MTGPCSFVLLSVAYMLIILRDSCRLFPFNQRDRSWNIVNYLLIGIIINSDQDHTMWYGSFLISISWFFLLLGLRRDLDLSKNVSHLVGNDCLPFTLWNWILGIWWVFLYLYHWPFSLHPFNTPSIKPLVEIPRSSLKIR